MADGVAAGVPAAIPTSMQAAILTRHGGIDALSSPIVNLSPAVAEELKVDANATGVVVYDVQDNSPAAAAGFRPGDFPAGPTPWRPCAPWS